ncbi:MAG: RraA family protein [Nitrososphaerales archaeon]|jgi:regulator of RNase E activity RraA
MRESLPQKTIFDRMEAKLYSAVISDVLDDIGLRDHTLNDLIGPIRADMVLAGRAKPMLASRVFEVPDEPYKVMIKALDSIKPGEVPVMVTNNDSSAAMWGELLSTASRARGARGTIIEGLARDTRQILEMGFPLFCTGTSPADSKGRSEVIEFDRRIRCGGASINHGDIVFADADGIVAIPQDVEDEVLARAYKKVSRENGVRRDLLRGELLGDAWRKHGIL